MIKGSVNRRLEPRVPILVHHRRPYRLQVVVDTGFNGYLMLARRHRKRMKLTYAAFQEFELADGRVSKERIYLGEATFDGRRQSVFVILTRSAESLVGTTLLRNKTLTIAFPSRQVFIR